MDPEASRSERVLITGASSGIGLATSIEFADRGARIALIARDVSGLQSSADQVRARGGDPLVTSASVTDRVALEVAVERAAAAFGGLDVALINAAATAYGPFTETNEDDFDRTLAVTLRGAIDTIRLVLQSRAQRWIAGRGRVGGRQIPLPLMSAYTAAKHGLRGCIDALQIELRSRGSSVSIALVSPGPVDTPFWDNVATQEGYLPPWMPGAYPPKDVAKAVVRCVRGAAAAGPPWAARWSLSALSTPCSTRSVSAFSRGSPLGPGPRASKDPEHARSKCRRARERCGPVWVRDRAW